MAKNDIKIGSSELSNIAIGNNDVDKVYLGKDLVWERYNCTVNLSRALDFREELIFEGDLACSFRKGEKTKKVRLNENKDTFTVKTILYAKIDNCGLISIINDGIVEPYYFEVPREEKLMFYHKGAKHNIDVMFYEKNTFQAKIKNVMNKDLREFSLILSINGTKYHITPYNICFFYADWYKEKDTIIDVELIEVSNRENLNSISVHDDVKGYNMNIIGGGKFSINIKSLDMPYYLMEIGVF